MKKAQRLSRTVINRHPGDKDIIRNICKFDSKCTYMAIEVPGVYVAEGNSGINHLEYCNKVFKFSPVN